MRNLAIATAVASAVALGVLLLSPAEAQADRTDLILSSSATWTSYEVVKSSTGGVTLEVCGYALKSDGGVVERNCHVSSLTGAALTAATNQGDTLFARWKNNAGL